MSENTENSIVPLETSRLLLFLSRSHLDETELEEANRLSKQILNWEEFSSIAERKFCVTFILKHLRELNFDISHPNENYRIREKAFQTTIATLRVAAAQQQFQENCLEPLKMDYVYLKGPSLAARYYADAGLRFSRDVDLLVSKSDQERLVRFAITKGYKIISAFGPKISDAEGQNLRALFRYNSVITLLSAGNVPIEIHRELSKKTGIFDAKEMLRKSEIFEFGASKFRVLPTELLFVYMCYHNTRHTWSRLHWLADLDAVMRHSSFDIEKTFVEAGRLGLRPTVEACIDFRSCAFRLQNYESIPPTSNGKKLLELCLANLSGDLELEREIRSSQWLLDLPFPWMVTGRVRVAVLAHHLIRRISPNFEQYIDWPLPDSKQWCYYAANLARGLRGCWPKRKKK